ncbi:MAG: B12-binding domain-containing radical SAM protein, partial [Deltaproteobacteria bacterium]|nr:B12-binding domain-containing radical SAM protein [Deltaproteobacteria bacterium]
MRIAVISTYTHPTRQRIKEPSVMQSAVPELIAGLCPPDAHIELYNEKEIDIPLDRDWDLVFFSYLHSYYEHTKVLSTLLRKRGVKTVAGGRHAGHFADDAELWFDAVITGEPEPNVPQVIADFAKRELKKRYSAAGDGAADIKPYRYDLIDYSHNRIRLPGIEASRGCPFTCNFCVLTGYEKYRFRPVEDVVNEIETRMTWNKNWFGLFDNTFIFLDNNLGGSPKYLRALCEALIPKKRIWGCALTFNILRDEELVKLMAKAGCRYIYTGLESLNPDSIEHFHKGQNKISEVDEVIRRAFNSGILLSFGLLVGSDGDTNDYLQRLPGYLSDLKYFSITFLGIVCPYPETPIFAQMKAENRLLPGTCSRDYDGYTLCHRPKQLTASETVDHFQRLCRELGTWGN